MRGAASQPERIDLASLVAARQAVRAALARLDKPPVSDSDVAAVQDALGQLSVLTDDWLWELLEAAAVKLQQAGPSDPQAAWAQEAAPAWRLVEELLAEASSDQPPGDVQRAIHSGQAASVVQVVRVQVQVFVDTAQGSTGKPPPSGDDDHDRRRWVAVARVILEKAVDLLTNVAVAAAFTVSAVQLAAERTVLGAADLTGRAVAQVVPALPALLAITAVAAQAAMGVKLIRETLQPIDQAVQRQASDRLRRLDHPAQDPAADVRQEARTAFSTLIDEARGRPAAQDGPRSQPVGPTGQETREALGLEPLSDSQSATQEHTPTTPVTDDIDDIGSPPRGRGEHARAARAGQPGRREGRIRPNTANPECGGTEGRPRSPAGAIEPSGNANPLWPSSRQQKR